MAVQKRDVKWVYGRCFDHYSDNEYSNRQKEVNILPMNLKFYFNDVVLFYKILYSLVSMKLPKKFTIVKGNETKFIRLVLSNHICYARFS